MEEPRQLLLSKKDFDARFREIHALQESCKQRVGEDPEALNNEYRELDNAFRETFGEWERFKIAPLLSEARKFNIDLPSTEDREAWAGLDLEYGLPYLSSNGILKLRRAIDEEKIRRREVAAWWWKTVIIPALAAATGLVGALTGLFAVLHRK